MPGTEKFAAQDSAVHMENGSAVVVFSNGADRQLEISMSIEAAQLLFAQLTRTLNAHQHPLPS